MSSPRWHDGAGKVPPLNLGSVPLLPGFRTHRDVDRLKPWHGKPTMVCTERKERENVPETDIVAHVHGTYYAAPPSDASSNQAQDAAARFQTSQRLAHARPTTPKVNKRIPHGARTKWLVYDREVLRFFMFFQEDLPEVDEGHRIRRVTLLYHRSNDAIEMFEPKVENSGLQQGAFLAKTPISKLAGGRGKTHLELKDFVVGQTVSLFGRAYTITDCDPKTRRFFRDELSFEQPEAIPVPEDPVVTRSQALASKAAEAAADASAAAQLNHTKDLRQFLKWGNKALLFDVLWDDSHREGGDKRRFQLAVFLADLTIEIREVFKPNSGREGFSKFLSRAKVFNPLTKKPYTLEDFRCGQTLEINKRDFLLVSCDAYTHKFYKTRLGIDQVTVEIPEEVRVLPKMPLPPYNGYGTEEDSLQSFYHLVPRQISKNMARVYKYGDSCFHIRCCLVTQIPQELGRIFDLKFQLAERTMSLYEPVQRNSGIIGGQFLENGTYTNAATGKPFHEDDLGAALDVAMQKRRGELPASERGDVLEIMSRQYQVLSADDTTHQFFGIPSPLPPKKSSVDPAEHIFRMIVHQLLSRKLNIRAMFERADKDGSKSIAAHEFKDMLEDAGVQINPGDLAVVMSKFSSGAVIFYQDWCDALSQHWQPPPRESKSRVEELQMRLLEKFRHSKTNLRSLFRQCDKDSNGTLSFDEFQKLVNNFLLMDVSDTELAAIMRLYDTEQTGVIDYHSFCNTVYELDFSGDLDKDRHTVDLCDQELSNDEYLAIARQRAAVDKQTASGKGQQLQEQQQDQEQQQQQQQQEEGASQVYEDK
ncbi:EF-hand domain-containing family member C2 [Hondaea fermentalgiana]|uniref:EF-hand domain-containing family member C2 n=1 Tax=Hondaea fermentalgiana TaxID=2315210 RepID=A0A2R5GVX3_9STRA|nr:EF-hand domain-containing family member C2 [Hondaea fermentalgiana]|eukprot:GBG34479.1 EF-hand domain-containing family member C2 [Hondaea fermentalgiana]